MNDEIEDVFCLYTNSKTGKTEVCILKSKAIKHFIEKDGMSLESAEEFFEFNVAGAKGKGQYSIIDDTICPEFILQLAEDKEVYDPTMHDFEGDIP